MHFHTIYSFNAEGYSPAKIAALAKQADLAAAGVVDFDVLDGLNEFYEAASKLSIKASGGIETRVFVPEFSDKVINSPGEPGIAYHMGAGIPSGNLSSEQKKFEDKLRGTAKNRNLELVNRVNKYLSPIELDYEKDILPLTPKGNATERHICFAYLEKAKAIFADKDKLAEFWKEKIGFDKISDSAALVNNIRAKTMKRGGVGYVQPDTKSFPTIAEMNKFVLSIGGIPTLAWLDGTSEGEKHIEELLRIAMFTGVEAVNIIPDRNYVPGEGKNNDKCRKMYEFVEICQNLDLPIIAGTEMNSPGQKFVDNFGSEELKPLVDVFYKGAMIVYGHTVLQRQAGLGYNSDWASRNFKSRADKNNFFETIGKKIEPAEESILHKLNSDLSPEGILKKV